MGAATELAVLLEDAVWRADAEATAPAIAHVHLRRALGDDAGTCLLYTSPSPRDDT